jgi:hypothetical protein
MLTDVKYVTWLKNNRLLGDVDVYVDRKQR